MCDPKSHRRCINKGILWRKKKNRELFISTVVLEPPAITLAATFQSWYAACMLVHCQTAGPLMCFPSAHPVLLGVEHLSDITPSFMQHALKIILPIY